MLKRIKFLVVLFFGVLGLSGCIVVDDDIPTYSHYTYNSYGSTIDYYHRPSRHYVTHHKHKNHVEPKKHHLDKPKPKHPANAKKHEPKKDIIKKPEPPKKKTKARNPEPKKEVVRKPEAPKKNSTPQKEKFHRQNPSKHHDINKGTVKSFKPKHH